MTLTALQEDTLLKLANASDWLTVDETAEIDNLMDLKLLMSSTFPNHAGLIVAGILARNRELRHQLTKRKYNND